MWQLAIKKKLTSRESDALLWLSLLLMLAASIWRRDMSTQTTFCLRMQAANGGVRPDVSVGNRGKGWNS